MGDKGQHPGWMLGSWVFRYSNIWTSDAQISDLGCWEAQILDLGCSDLRYSDSWKLGCSDLKSWMLGSSDLGCSDAGQKLATSGKGNLNPQLLANAKSPVLHPRGMEFGIF